jgi:hypothetical protein
VSHCREEGFSNESLDIDKRTFYTLDMANVAEHQIKTLASLCLPRSSAMHWDPTAAKLALQQLRRLRGEIAAFEAVLVGVLKDETGRDTSAMLARGFGINTACDAAWRAAHPERAETVGGHEDDPREQRLADAFVAIMNGTALGGQAHTALIVTIKAETLEANIAGVGPIPVEDALNLADDPRTDLYAAVQAMDGAIMKFGRDRRFASPMQKLALVVRDGGFCTKAGCEQPWYRCDADHIDEWDSGGLTNIEDLRLLCRCSCHKHRHETGENLTRQPDGTWTVDHESFPALALPPPKPRNLEADQGFRLLCRKLGRPDPHPELAA